ncbi:hypothetical protein ATK30_4839 [Amycolatopsis echigonensis]|uniref:Uncharacterized protein n=1 Tax=Amycolatopsis echigonensis TaxID=2576905 RepID=A0A2N3WJE4_9PSEU|nr:hypothetical protein ATK30_4839 [Amycolatopsis niigatensis]
MANRKRLGPGWLAGICVLGVIGLIGNACGSKDAGPSAPASVTVPLTTPAYSPVPTYEPPTTSETPTSTPTFSLPSDDPADTGTGSGGTVTPLPDDTGGSVHVPHIPHPHGHTCVGGKHIHICS